jgi:hypothetical protein
MMLVVVPRADWGSQATLVPQTHDAKPEVYVHHVAGRWPTSLGDEEAHMRELQAYAINTKHYVDLDYNVLIGPSGRCYEGRGYFGMAAATKDRNAVSRAVCLMGNLDTREPSQAQLDALPLLLADMVEKGSLMARVTVLGHFENPAHIGATACPGRFMKPHLPGVRSRLDALLHPSLPPAPAPSPPPQEDDDMPKPEMRRFDGYRNVFHFEAGHYSHGTAVTVQRANDRGDEMVVLDWHPQGLKCALRQSGLDDTDLVPE